ncbi:hypothetical protein HYPSUDRAFT_37677 [Hypholoma sublateritium FD-334 SS-4]|uniref:Protein kinase domain-containing protein n=1 Tax=Hypholoma sublateritium (strain FD-334 SS-4) TaxID=945553 RepID=A0A0D2P442_HYPSF|nr:hypothetical protein HYPSUDRAFT_37677 [Hypholoma sublateritium FD-334 SS-4]
MSQPSNRCKVIGDGLLQPWEEFWVVHQSLLLERGYKLRNRYNPDWTPSWYGKKKVQLYKYPDARCAPPKKILDAVRVSDGKKVTLKVVDIDRDIPILQYLNSPSLLADERNHTVPILDKFPVPHEEHLTWIVMPFLLMFQAPIHPFRYVSEIIEPVTQFLEGLEFMHEHGIAHRDACFFNLMVDSTKLVPDGDVSFSDQSRTEDLSRLLTPVARRSVAPLRYFFIDFETAVRFSPDDKNPRCVGRFGQEHDAPELSDTVPYNPFKLDIYQLGMIFPPLFKAYDGMEFLEPLHEAMTCANPDERPTAAEANAMFKGMISSFTDDDMQKGIWEKRTPLKYRRRVESPKPKRTLRT